MKKMFKHSWFVLIFIFSSIGNLTHQELFTALVDLEKLLDTERVIVSSLDAYLASEEKRLQKLKIIRENYLQMHSLASQNIQLYLANPVNAYLLVKRLTTDWKNAESLIIGVQSEIGKQIITNLKNNGSMEILPSNEDLSGAADALLRLQDTYKLETSNLAKGVFTTGQSKTSTPFNLELTSSDCFELGRHSYINGDHYHTILWMREALDRCQEEDKSNSFKVEIIEYLAFSTYHQGNVHEALRLTNQILRLDPTHARAKGNKFFYEDFIRKNTKSNLRGDEGDNSVPLDNIITAKTNEVKEETERDIYESLCRGEKRLSVSTESKLKCYFLNTKNKPYLRLMKIKVEEAFKRPMILLFHDVLTDKDISFIKEFSYPKLKRATVQNYKTGDLETAHYRISKSAWLTNTDHEIIENLSKRIEAITGLTTSTAEELQVVNYGIGGHYEPHFDFARREEKDAFKGLGTGNRIATWLNYMSDVEAGGATVFPAIGVTLWPRKGSAAFWYNLHKNGEGDMLTRHAACPVLIGSKWVSNKWFHERGQEFRRPCGLKIND